MRFSTRCRALESMSRRTRAAWVGKLSLHGLTVDYSIESRNGKAVAFDLTSRYSFPVRVSSRALQDWTIGTRTGVVAQSYLDGSVYLAELPIQEPVTEGNLFDAVQNGMAAFSLFQSSYVKRLGGQQVFDQPTILPPKPADRLVVDYLSAPDFNYLARLWGWSYDGPFGAAIGPMWTVPIKVHRRLWKITGPGTSEPGTNSVAAFTLTGQFQARTRWEQDRFRKWSHRFKTDHVTIYPSSADVEVSTTIDLTGGMSLNVVRRKILEFVRRAEKLPAADTGVFG